MKKLIKLFLVACSLIVLVSCTNTEETSTANNQISESTTTNNEISNYPLEITNYKLPEGGGTPTEFTQIFEESPKAILANNQTTGELLVELGLKDSIVGVSAVFNEINPSIEKEFNSIPNIYTEYIPKEVAIGISPDIILGRSALFDNADWGVGTVDDLQAMDIHTYLLNAGKEDATIEDIFLDISEIGKIFDVEERATEFSNELRGELDNITDSLSEETESKTYVYCWSSDPEALSFISMSNGGLQNDALSYLNLENAFPDVESDISLESLIGEDPDIILYPVFSDTDIKEQIINNPKLADLTAIQNDAVYPINYNYFFGYGHTTVDGILELGQLIYPDLLGEEIVG
ncbi:MAG: ABC transporter substrate-binding protein [Lachnospirales bacterium]